MDASKAWVEKLKGSGYEHHCSSTQDVETVKRLGRIWSETLVRTKLDPHAKLFELGCGGGRYLASLALNEFETHGIDISPEVVARCQNYLNEVKAVSNTQMLATVENADIFNYDSFEQYDLVYHFGVVEHFLEPEERKLIWQKLYQLTKPGGWMMSAVPNGSHFWRGCIRKNHLCGYDVPEIDYSVRLHENEFLNIGLQDVIALPWNYFGFAEDIVYGKISKSIAKVIFLSSNVLMPLLPLPRSMKEKFAHGLLAFGRKPE
jgi:2-polyprenyl-3-methyl-5-hydroxy-6-metoxy-1,4-benzoquinol methylase